MGMTEATKTFFELYENYPNISIEDVTRLTKVAQRLTDLYPHLTGMVSERVANQIAIYEETVREICGKYTIPYDLNKEPSAASLCLYLPSGHLNSGDPTNGWVVGLGD